MARGEDTPGTNKQSRRVPARGQAVTVNATVTAATTAGSYVPAVDLTTSSPDVIDTAWAEAIEEPYAQIARAQRLLDQAQNYQTKLDEAAAQGKVYRGGITQEKVDAWQREGAELLREAQSELERIEAPFNAEWEKRGTWTRAYKVMNGNGHIHSSTRCSTCNKMGKPTQFAWITELSGYDEKEIAELAGEAACTVCYPDAPVDKPNRIFTKQEKLDQAAKDKKAAERATKQAEQAAKAITDVDGSPLRDNLGSIIKTERSARNELTNALLEVMTLNGPYMMGREGTDDDTKAHYTKLIEQYAGHAERYARAIAAKTGEDQAEITAEHQAKADKKFAKLLKEWDTSPYNPKNQ